MAYERFSPPIAERPPPTWPQRRAAWWRLIRGDRPVGTLLLLWPTLWALWLAAEGFPPPGTLAIFVVVIPFLLLLLPAESPGVAIGRSVFFVVGAAFSGLTGFMGMWLAVRGNLRVAAAARESGEKVAMRIA